MQANGKREVFFETFGVPRVIEVEDRTVNVAARDVRPKAEIGVEGSVGAPMGGDVLDVRRPLSPTTTHVCPLHRPVPRSRQEREGAALVFGNKSVQDTGNGSSVRVGSGSDSRVMRRCCPYCCDWSSEGAVPGRARTARRHRCAVIMSSMRARFEVDSCVCGCRCLSNPGRR